MHTACLFAAASAAFAGFFFTGVICFFFLLFFFLGLFLCFLSGLFFFLGQLLFLLLHLVSANCAVFFRASAARASAASRMDGRQGTTSKAYQADNRQAGKNLL